MLALSFWQPWLWAILEGYKPLENRSWPPWRSLAEGTPFALHAASRQPTDNELEDFACLMHDLGHVDVEIPFRDGYEYGAVLGVARLRTSAEDLKIDHPFSDWWAGPGQWAWIFDHVAKLPAPVPCKGRQGIWTLDRETEKAIQEDWRESKVTVFRWPERPHVLNIRHFLAKKKRPLLPPLPEPYLYIGRGTPLGNPFSASRYGTDALRRYREWLWGKIQASDEKVLRYFSKITPDHYLGCSCKPSPCHGDVVVNAWEWLRKERPEIWSQPTEKGVVA